MAHDIVRIRAITRQPLRIDGSRIQNVGDGTSVDLLSPRTPADLRRYWFQRYIVLGDSVAGANAGSNSLDTTKANADMSLTAGVVLWTGIELGEGETFTGLTYYSGATAANTPSNQVVGLYSSDGTTLTQRAISTDLTTTAWAASSAQAFTFTSSYTTAAAGVYYLAIVVAGTGAPSLAGRQPLNAAVANVDATKVYGTSGTSATTVPTTQALSGVTASNIVPFVKLG